MSKPTWNDPKDAPRDQIILAVVKDWYSRTVKYVLIEGYFEDGWADAYHHNQTYDTEDILSWKHVGDYDCAKGAVQ